MNNKSFGKKLAQLRKDKHMTQEQLALKLNVSNKTISKWETDATIPDVLMIKEITKLFHVNLDDLIDESLACKTSKDKKLLIYTKKIHSFIFKNIFKIFFIIAFILLLIFFISNYKVVEIYRIKNDNDEVDISNGFYVHTKAQDYLIINDIKIYNVNYNPVHYKASLYTHINGDVIYLHETDDLECIVLYDIENHKKTFTNEIVEGIHKGLYLSIEVIDDKNEVHNYVTKFSLKKEFVNNKFVYFNSVTEDVDTENKRSINLEFNITKEELLNANFKRIAETSSYIKFEDNMEITIDFDLNKVTITKSENKYKETYTIDYPKEKFTYLLTQNSKLIMKQTYEYQKDELSCVVDDCEDYLNHFEYLLNTIHSFS